MVRGIDGQDHISSCEYYESCRCLRSRKKRKESTFLIFISLEKKSEQGYESNSIVTNPLHTAPSARLDAC